MRRTVIGASPAGTLATVNRPSGPVAAPSVVPRTETLAAVIGLPVAESTTVPRSTRPCAARVAAGPRMSGRTNSSRLRGGARIRAPPGYGADDDGVGVVGRAGTGQ